jgi:uracil-DNA glycosylase family 4
VTLHGFKPLELSDLTRKGDLPADAAKNETFADCASCELKSQCDAKQTAYAYVPEKFNGIMIVGEGPGHNEVVKKRPFVGRSGQLLRGLLKTAGIEMDECFITNATLCKPKYTASDDSKEGFMKTFPHAVQSCLPRLRAEIRAVQPKVILTFGTPALAALTGGVKEKLKREPWVHPEKRPQGCPTCLEARKIPHVIECSAKKPSGEPCGFTTYWETEPDPFDADNVRELPRDVKTRPPTEAELEPIRGSLCPGCSSKRKKAQPKQVKCPTCHGLKTFIVKDYTFHYDYTVGKVAGAVFLPEKLEGGLFDAGVDYVVPTYHPSFLMRPPVEGSKAMAGQFAATAVVRHLEQAKKLLNGGTLAYEAIEKRITKNPQDIYDYVLGTEADPDWKFDREFELDIETESWHWNRELNKGAGDWEPVPDKGSKEVGEASAWTVTEITCVGIYHPDRKFKLVIDTRSDDAYHADIKCDQAIIDALIDCFHASPTPVSMQNGQYDAIVLRRIYGLVIKCYADDTLVSHHALCPDENHNLAHQAHSYAALEPWKPPKRVKGMSQWKSYDELCEYNARDLAHTRLVREAHGAHLGKAQPGSLLVREKVDQVYHLDMQLQKVAVEMEWRGLPVNEQSIKRVGIQALRQRDEHKLRLCEMLNEPSFDPTKPGMLQWALYDPNGPLKLQMPAKTKTGKGTTEKSHLARMAGEVPFVHELLLFREHHKIVQDFILGAGFPIREDGRMHPSWRIWGARTGRWSSSPNFQNLPDWLRAVVETADGRCIVGADADQLELRGIAQLSGDAKLLQLCLNANEERKLEPEWDPHSYLASKVFGDTYLKLSLDDPNHSKDKSKKCRCETCTRKDLRTVAKTVFYAINYGGGAPTILEGIYKKKYSGPPITVELVARIIRTVFREFPGVDKYRQRLLAGCIADREVRSPLLGRRREFPLGEVPPTEIYNYPLQSLGADLFAEIILDLEEALRDVDPTAFLMAYVHDALYVECSVAKQREVSKLLTELMTRTITINGIEMPYTASAKIGTNWKEVS